LHLFWASLTAFSPKVACGVGRLMGLPVPTAADLKDSAADAIASQTDFLSSMLDGVTESMNEQPELEGVTAWMDEKMLAMTDEYTDTEVAEDAESIPPQGKVVQQSFAAVQARGGHAAIMCTALQISNTGLCWCQQR
jgi:hypothetical protein